MEERVFDSEQAEKVISLNGIDVYRINTGKFKTNSIHFFFLDNLTRNNATKNALLPAVMRRGSEEFPTSRDISIQLEKLYGASFDCGVTKKGEVHVMHFYTEFLSKRYIPDGNDTFFPALDMLFNIITRPAFENGVFRQDYTEQEKDKLKMLIESRVNDKMQYSVDRCLEEVCRNEPFAIYDYGYVEDIPPISAEDLANHYRMMLETYPLQVYLIGDISDNEAEAVGKRLSKLSRGNVARISSGFSENRNTKTGYVTEKMNVTQGKLCLGFRTNTAPDSGDFYSLLVYNGILGGGIHSKLFQNVREKAGLAYYAHSQLEKFKGLMVVSSGIDFKNKDKALDIMLEQLDEIKNGVISDYEIDATLKSIETGIRSLGDNQIYIADFYLSQTISGTKDSFDDVIKKVKEVTRDDIVRVARNIALDTVYFLASNENNE